VAFNTPANQKCYSGRRSAQPKIVSLISENRDLEKELELLNTIVLEETRSFFQRVLDSELKQKEPSNPPG
jgi:hypothetical protein